MKPARCAIDGYALLADGTCGACVLRRSRRCMDCGDEVVGRSWRCEKHKKEKVRLDRQCSEDRNKKDRRARERERYWADEARRRRKLELKKEWREKNPVRLAMYKRKNRLEGTNGYRSRAKHLAYQRRYNKARREQKRQAERDRYYRQHPDRPDPHCADCGKAIDWTPGRGRPPKYHYECSPWKAQRRPPVEAAA